MFRIITLIFILSTFTFAQNNLIIFSENTQLFQIKYQNQLIPSKPQADVKLTKITDNPIHIQIIFDNKNLLPIDTTIYLFYPSKPINNQDIIYLITRDNKTLKYLATLPSSDLQPIIPEIDTSAIVKTKQEKEVQKIIFYNDSTANCIYPIDTADFNKAIQFISKTPNVDRKIVFIEQFIKHNCFSQTQANIIIEQIPFEVEKLKIIKQLIPKLTSVFNLREWKNYFQSSVSQQLFIEYYTNYLQNLNQHPTLSDSLLAVYLQHISALNDDHSKVIFIQIILSHHSISIKQLEILTQIFHHDQHKEEIIQSAYYSLQNRNDFQKTYNFVHFNETKERLKSFYDKQK